MVEDHIGRVDHGQTTDLHRLGIDQSCSDELILSIGGHGFHITRCGVKADLHRHRMTALGGEAPVVGGEADAVVRNFRVGEVTPVLGNRRFQAIRIFINGELDEITMVLEQVIDVLAPQGRMAVISFHSLEDRIVKRFIRDEYRGEQPPEEFPLAGMDYVPRLKPVGKAIRAAAAEVDQNPRARSAVLRVAERLQ